MRGCETCAESNKMVTTTMNLTLVANITSAQLLNGMCRLSDYNATTLLIADSQAGRIFKLDADTGSLEILIEDESLKNSPNGLQVAVNGIHVHRSPTSTWASLAGSLSPYQLASPLVLLKSLFAVYKVTTSQFLVMGQLHGLL